KSASLRDSGGVSVRETIRRAAIEQGFFRMTQPRAFGGTEAGPLALALVRDTLGSYNTGLHPLTFGPRPGVLAHVADPLRSSRLAPLLDGTKRAGFAFTEPDDAPRFTTATPDGDAFVVRGRKSYVTGGAHADFLNTLVEVPGQGRAMLVIDTST